MEDLTYHEFRTCRLAGTFLPQIVFCKRERTCIRASCSFKVAWNHTVCWGPQRLTPIVSLKKALLFLWSGWNHRTSFRLLPSDCGNWKSVKLVLGASQLVKYLSPTDPKDLNLKKWQGQHLTGTRPPWWHPALPWQGGTCRGNRPSDNDIDGGEKCVF